MKGSQLEAGGWGLFWDASALNWPNLTTLGSCTAIQLQRYANCEHCQIMLWKAKPHLIHSTSFGKFRIISTVRDGGWSYFSTWMLHKVYLGSGILYLAAILCGSRTHPKDYTHNCYNSLVWPRALPVW